MSRYRSNRLPAASGHAVGIEEGVNDFLLYHPRKGYSESYLRELQSYLIGGSGYYGKRRAWLLGLSFGPARLSLCGTWFVAHTFVAPGA